MSNQQHRPPGILFWIIDLPIALAIASLPLIVWFKFAFGF